MLEQVLQYLEGVNPVYIALASAVLALTVSFVTVARIAHLNRQIKNDKDKLEKRLRIVTSGAVGMGERLVQLETRLTGAINGQFQAAETEAQHSYTQALKLIESGVDHSIIASNSGLSESEINLMKLLHQSKQGAKQNVF